MDFNYPYAAPTRPATVTYVSSLVTYTTNTTSNVGRVLAVNLLLQIAYGRYPADPDAQASALGIVTTAVNGIPSP